MDSEYANTFLSVSICFSEDFRNRSLPFNLPGEFCFLIDESNFSGKLRHGPPIYHSKTEGGDLSQNTFAVES